MFETTHLRTHIDEISEKMWTLVPCSQKQSEDLLQCALKRMQHGQFRAATLAATRKVTEQIRNDQIFWLDSQQNDLEPAESEFLQCLDSLRQTLQTEFRISLSEIECHYAHYEPGHFYQKHRDTTVQNNHRVFSFVLYLNKDWQSQYGGQLIGYQRQEVAFEIQPELGQMILFRSDLEHEVKITERDRWSLTGWFRK